MRFGHGGRVEERFSLEVGAVLLTERFGLGGTVSEDELDRGARRSERRAWAPDGRPTPDALAGMGGARRIVGLQAKRAEVILAGGASFEPCSRSSAAGRSP
jgi:exopolyphosphatase/pppGpp-phosphohydrolase